MPSLHHKSKKRKPSFYIADPELRGNIGHYLVYARTIAAEAEKNGFDATILAHRDFAGTGTTESIKPAFKLTMWECPKISGSLGAAIGFFRDLRKAVRAGGIDSRSIVFGPSVFRLQILGWALFALTNLISPKPRIVILLRYQPSLYRSVTAWIGFRILETIARRARVEMVTDSHRLAADYREITSLPFGVLPIPHGVRTSSSSRKRSRPERSGRAAGKLRFVSLGNARDEKGILEILTAIQSLAELGLDRKLEFVLQVNAPYPDAISADIERARKPGRKNVVFIDKQLSSGEYDALLESADAVLLPYWPSIYRSRTSGPFAEAIAAGKPAVVSRGTWMADFAEISSFCEFCAAQNPTDLARAILSLARRIESKTIEIKEFGKKWRDYHNARHFMRTLLQSDFHLPFKLAESPPARNALIVLPWQYSSIKLSGAGVRIGAMFNFLLAHFDRVHLIEPDPSQKSDLPEGIVQHTIRPENAVALAISKVAAEIGYIRHGTKNQDNNIRIWIDSWFVYWFLRYRLSRRAKLAFRDFLAANPVQTIFVEYPFSMPMVAKAAADNKIPLIVTNHDVLANGIFDSWISSWVRRLETSAIAKADTAVSITDNDKKLFQANGLRSTVVPNSIDPGRLRYISKAGPRVVLSTSGIVVPKGIIALFLGSRHYPNMEAAKQLKALAENGQIAGSRIKFVIAGECAPPESRPAFQSLGAVSDEALMALYEISNFILVPLRYGTGSSIKTIEAMALGKIVIGTKVGFRGLRVRNGVECIIEEDLSKYPRLMAGLAGDKKRLRRISDAARKFGESYDFRKTYLHYLDLAGYQPNGFSSARQLLPGPQENSRQIILETLSRCISAQAKITESRSNLVQNQSNLLQSRHNLAAAQEEFAALSGSLRKALRETGKIHPILRR